VGFNYRITNLQAAIGQSQIWRVNEDSATQRRIAELYREALMGIPDVRFRRRCPTNIVCRVDDLRAGTGGQRLLLMRAAHEAQIETRPFFHPLSALPPYGKYARDCQTA